jgi:hypothetical protein
MTQVNLVIQFITMLVDIQLVTLLLEEVWAVMLPLSVIAGITTVRLQVVDKDFRYLDS